MTKRTRKKTKTVYTPPPPPPDDELLVIYLPEWESAYDRKKTKSPRKPRRP